MFDLWQVLHMNSFKYGIHVYPESSLISHFKALILAHSSGALTVSATKQE